MSATIEAGLRLQIADLQAGYAAAKAETAKFKQDMINKGSDLDKKLFEQVEKHKLNLSKARQEVEDIRAMFKAKGDRLEKDFFEKFEKHKLDLGNLKAQLKQVQEMQRGGGAGAVFGGTFAANLAYDGLNRGVSIMENFTRRGIEFNAVMDNSQVGIANLLKKFDGLDEVAAKAEAAKALARIVELEPSTAGSLQDLTMGFMQTLAAAKSVGFTTEQNVNMTAKFANALSNAGLQADQLAQEYRSILSGNITSDSQLAKILGITNDEVAKIKATGGDLFAFLDGKIGDLGRSGDSASVAWSSFQSSLDKAAGAFASGMFEQGVQAAKDLSVWLEANKDLFTDLGRSATDAMGLAVSGLKKTLEIVKEIKDWLDEPAKAQARAKDLHDTAAALRNPQDVYVETTNTKDAADARAKDRADLEKEKLMALNARRAHDGLSPLKSLPVDKPAQDGGGSGSGSKKKSLAQRAAERSMASGQREAAVIAREDDKAARTRERLQDETARDKYDGLDLTGKIKSKQADVAKFGSAAAAAPAGRNGEQTRLDNLLEQAQAQRELNALLKEQSASLEEAKVKRESERDTFIKGFEKQKEGAKALREEMMMSAAKARGDKDGLAAMERELKIRAKAKEIEDQAGVGAKQARASAEFIVAANEKADKAALKKEETVAAVRDDGAKHIGGVKNRRMMGGGLDEFYRNNGDNADAIGSHGLSSRRGSLSQDTGMLSSRHSGNAARADAAESARNDRDPNTDILKNMFDWWKEQLS